MTAHLLVSFLVAQAAEPPPEPHVEPAEMMRIAVGAPAARVIIEGEGIERGADNEEAEFESLPGSRIVVTVGPRDGLSIAGVPWTNGAARFRARSHLSIPGTTLRGELAVLRVPGGLQVVNILPLEDYLAGVLGNEMPRSFPEEALKAQAVAARTYALFKKLSQRDKPYYLDSSVISQVYRGLAAEDPRTSSAVAATRGIILTYALQPIGAFFHASCGGKTESGLEALSSPAAYLVPVDCPCASETKIDWTLTLTPKDFARLGVAENAPLQIVERTETGRAKRVQVGALSFTGAAFRARLGYTRVRSLQFTVEQTENDTLLRGRGYGHGAGLCQLGARLLAEQGWTYERILEHYYPGTELQRLYD